MNHAYIWNDLPLLLACDDVSIDNQMSHFLIGSLARRIIANILFYKQKNCIIGYRKS
jgi:hypothetical protein